MLRSLHFRIFAGVFAAATIVPVVPAGNGLIAVAVFEDPQGQKVEIQIPDEQYAKMGGEGGAAFNPTDTVIAGVSLKYTGHSYQYEASMDKQTAFSTSTGKMEPKYPQHAKFRDVDGYQNLLQFLTPNAIAAIARDTSLTGTASTVTSHTDAYTVGASATLLVVFHVFSTAPDSTATWNGSNMTVITGLDEVAAFNCSGGCAYKMTGWYMNSPTTGTHNVVTGTSGSAFQQAYIYSYNGTDTTSAVIDGTNTKGPTGSASSLSSNITVTAANSWIVALAINSSASAGIAGSGAITKLTYTGSMTSMTADSNTTVSTGSVAYGYTGAASSEGNLFAISIKEASAAAATPEDDTYFEVLQ